jgi:hypothetical protein
MSAAAALRATVAQALLMSVATSFATAQDADAGAVQQATDDAEPSDGGALDSAAPATEAPAGGEARDEPAMRVAREHFDRGRAAYLEGRLGEARAAYRRSLEVFPTAAAAFNLAVATSEAGEAAAADAICAALVRGEHGPLDVDLDQRVRSLRSMLAPRLATLLIHARGSRAIRLTVDGRSVGTPAAGEPALVRVDPGAHVVRASAPSRIPAERSLSAAAGSRHSVSLDLLPVAPPGDRERDETSGFFASAWVWIVAAVVVAGAAVTLAVVLGADDSEPFFGTIEALAD